jgi:beta-aspartyl-peptidase (threonine type)
MRPHPIRLEAFMISRLRPDIVLTFLLITSVFLSSTSCAPRETNGERINIEQPVDGTFEDVMLIIHGGAGTIRKSSMTPEREAQFRDILEVALRTGHRILEDGGSSLDAVEAVIRTMEDSPLFNAGKGAVFTAQGRNEMDSSIMDGSNRNAGAVASVTGIRNPISAARKVLTESKHVMLVGEGAATFAREQGLEFADSAYFFTQHRWDRLQEIKKQEASQSGALPFADDKFGTVGCVALDKDGNLAAGTSTGGLTNKRWGRVGDSPIIGAGTYADNSTCGVSCTGTGELFIRGALAYRVAALMEHGFYAVGVAAREVIHSELVDLGGTGTGGLVALDRRGTATMQFNTEGMYRGFIRADGIPQTFLYKD